MKKNLKLLLLVIAAVAVALSIAGCKKTTLDIPANLQINEIDKTLSWHSVEGAAGYTVQIDDNTRIILDGNSATTYSLLSLTNAGTYSLKVKALSGEKGVKDSKWSSAVTYTVSAAPTAGLDFKLIDNGTAYEVSVGTAATAQIVIPSTRGQIPVTRIANSGFSNMTQALSVVIPSSVTVIGESAFLGCGGLSSVLFEGGSKLTSISFNAFYGCSGLASIKLPSSVTNIGLNAFFGCSGLESVTFESNSNLTKIEESAFSDCVGLANINFEANSKLTTIGNNAFSGCIGLTSAIIPSSVTNIGSGIFWGCSGLNSITFAGNSKLTSISDNAFWGCTGLKTVEFKADSALKSIGYNAFSGCTGLNFIKLPSITSIGDSAFSGCRNLVSIFIPSTLMTVGNNAFKDCVGLNTVFYEAETAEDWAAITVGSFNDYLNAATIYYYSAVETEGNYWFNLDGVPTKWNT